MSSLRHQAEERVRKEAKGLEKELDALSPTAIKQLIHELRVHQFELEIQNEELRTAQLELELARARYFELYDRAPVGYLTLTPKGIVLKANRAARALLKNPKSELLGRPVTDLILAEDQDILYLLRQELKGKGEAVSCELRVKRSQRWVEITATNDIVPEGDAVILLLVSDIQERRDQAEERAQVSQRLFRAQNLESIVRLAGGVAHEFNNLLTIILANAELALEQLPTGHPCREDVLQVHAAGLRSSTLVKLLLGFARKQQVAPQVVYLETVSEALGQTLAALVGHEISLQYRAIDRPWPVRIDPDQLTQILSQLCLNSREAMNGKGSITIESSNRSYDQASCDGHIDCLPGDYLQLRIQDDGCGISAENLARVFEPFFTTNTEASGTGLGLASVYGSVLQNRGFVTVSSAPGQGSTFEVNLPRHLG